MIRVLPCVTAWSKAKAVPDKVFPPPVGTVKEKRPEADNAAFLQSARILQRSSFTELGAALDVKVSMAESNPVFKSTNPGKRWRLAALSGDMNVSVSR